ncbi:type II toxin-antitoxin system VapC family toxin [Brevundimonas sp. VNH65]|uniref:type II toxin-antitoxin system VapC family toxin n=1 Tax=Brevundimonas sp. VNH65 TaxID=3400917 RepID=UPI003C0B1FD5
MRIAVDTNVILRLLVRDDETQTRIALREVENADTVVLPVLAICEAAWVMQRSYKFSRPVIAESLRRLIETPSIDCDRAEVEAGLAMLDLGGDFADGVIARQGRSRRAEHLVTFDRKAVDRLGRIGEKARLAGTE